MILTRRFHLLWILGLLPFLLLWYSWPGGNVTGPAVYLLAGLLVGYDLLLVGLAWLDWRRTEIPTGWLVTRHLPPRLMLGVENQIRISLKLPVSRSLSITLRDETPVGLELRGAAGAVLQVDPVDEGWASAEMSYGLLADRRGDFQFGDIVLRWPSPRGLLLRQHRFAAAVNARVYPNLVAARRQALAARQQQQLSPGGRLSGYRGQGREFESLREYVAGDELRHVSWTATARRGRLTTRQYQIERNQSIMIVIDAGRLMTARIDRLTKLDYAIEAALTIASLAISNGDLVGLLVFERQVIRYLPPRKGRNGENGNTRLTDFLEALYNVEPRLIEPSYRRAFDHLTRLCRKRSLVIILTDLVDRDASAELLASAAALLPEHLPLIVTIGDRDLRQLVREEPATVEDVYRQSVAEEMLRQRELALGWIVDHGGLVLDLPAGSLAPGLLQRYLEIKARGLL